MSIANTAIILAAGQGSRMGSGTRKQYMNLCGAPLFTYCARTFEQSSIITDIILVIPEGDEEICTEALRESGIREKVRKIVHGGAERYNSVMNGLHAIDWPCDYVFIHDGARPFIDESSLRRLYETVQRTGACVAGMPSKDTVKITNEEALAVQTPNRSNVWIVQTPQVFERALITDSYERMLRALPELERKGIKITDDAMAVEQMSSRDISMVEASYRNIKITTPEDIYVAEAFIENGWER